MKTLSNSPAFPETEFYDEKPVGLCPGLTKREYFAAMAMQAILTRRYGQTESTVKEAVEVADALIEEMNKEDSNNEISYDEVF